MSASGSTTHPTSQVDHLTRRDFFHDVAEALRQLLPEPLRDFHANATFNLLKVSYGTPRIHYEVWANARDRHIEVGLHFEDGPESTERLLSFLNQHIVEIKHELGAGFELERWTNSWGHLFQLIPYQPLTDELTREISLTVARMITLLQPLLTEAGETPRVR